MKTRPQLSVTAKSPLSIYAVLTLMLCPALLTSQTQRRRPHIAWNVGHSRALEKQKHCEDREIDSTWCGVDTGYRG